MANLTKILTEPEFKEKCKNKGITYTIRLWNQYVDYAWKKAMEEMGLDKQYPFDIMR